MSIVDRGQLFFVFSGWVLKKYLTNGRSSRNRWHFRSSTLTASRTAYRVTQQVLKLKKPNFDYVRSLEIDLKQPRRPPEVDLKPNFSEFWNSEIDLKLVGSPCKRSDLLNRNPPAARLGVIKELLPNVLARLNEMLPVAKNVGERTVEHPYELWLE